MAGGPCVPTLSPLFLLWRSVLLLTSPLGPRDNAGQSPYFQQSLGLGPVLVTITAPARRWNPPRLEGVLTSQSPREEDQDQWFGPNGFSLQSPTFFALGTGFVEDSYSMDWERVNGFGMIQAHHTYHACFCYYYYISSTSARKALGPGGQGLLEPSPLPSLPPLSAA